MDNLELFKILLKNYKIKNKNKEYISPKEMNITDNNCEYLGIPKIILMENAGKSIADEVVNYLDENKKNKIYINTNITRYR